PWCFAEQLAAHRHQPSMPWSMIDIPQLWLHVAAINPRIAQTQLLDGPAFAIALERLRQGGYDHIVVDAPPVLGSADVNLMADAADAVAFALRAWRSTSSAAATSPAPCCCRTSLCWLRAGGHGSRASGRRTHSKKVDKLKTAPSIEGCMPLSSCHRRSRSQWRGQRSANGIPTNGC